MLAVTMAEDMVPSAPKDECVKVCVRVRPLSSKEKQDGRMKIATTDNATAEDTRTLCECLLRW